MKDRTKIKIKTLNLIWITNELMLLLFSLHFARIWDIIHNHIVISDPSSLAMLYMDSGTSSFAVATSAIHILLSKYCLYFNGMQASTMIRALLIWTIFSLVNCGMTHSIINNYIYEPYEEPRRINEPDWKAMRETPEFKKLNGLDL